MTAWAVKLRSCDALAIAPLRLRAGIEVCAQGDELFVRGAVMDKELDRLLRQVPGKRYAITPEGKLIPDGSLIPREVLPLGPWVGIAEYVAPAAQTAAAPGKLEARVALRLVRSGVEREANILVTTLREWQAWAAAAPAVRLRALSFAASGDGRVIVRGTPLPAVVGERFVEQAGIAIPAGLMFDPPVEMAIVQRLIQLAPTELAVFVADGSFERIAGESFVPATRSAARLTAQAVGGTS